MGHGIVIVKAKVLSTKEGAYCTREVITWQSPCNQLLPRLILSCYHCTLSNLIQCPPRNLLPSINARTSSWHKRLSMPMRVKSQFVFRATRVSQHCEPAYI